MCYVYILSDHMTEINVILESKTTGLNELNPEDREILFESLAAANPHLQKSTVSAFSDIQSSIIQRDVLFQRPTLRELLLRKIILMATNHGSSFNTAVIPIMSVVSSTNIDKKGGAIGMFRRTKEAKIVNKSAIRVRFDTQILAINNEDYIVPRNEEIDVIGLVINPICSKPKTMTTDGLKPLTAVKYTQPTIAGYLTSGSYDHRLAARTCGDEFIKPNYDINIAGVENDEALVFNFDGQDDVKILTVLNAIFDYLRGLELYYDESASFIYAQLRLALGTNTTGILPKLVKIMTFINYQQPPPFEFPAKSPLCSLIESIHNGRFTTSSSLAVVADMAQRGFLDIYQTGLIRGKDDSTTLAKIAAFKNNTGKKAHYVIVHNKQVAEQSKLNTYLLIIEKKFGTKRKNELMRKIPSTVAINAAKILELLTPSEKKVCEVEYKHHEEYLAAVINNKCPHVKLYKQFRLCNDDRKAQRLYGELKNYFSNSKVVDAKISCSNCKFSIICPHLCILTEYTMQNKSQGEIKAALTKYIGPAVTDQYFCKICGEVISTLEVFGDKTDRTLIVMDEDLKNFMWGEIGILMKYLKFSTVVNVPMLITAVRDACYPFIFEIEKQILKSKTNTAAEIKAKSRLYITIYAFAFFIQLISGRQKSVLFKNFTVGSKNPVVDMIKHSIDIIMSTRNIVIREIPGMTVDVIKNTLIDAYKMMQASGGREIVIANESEELLTTILLDPVYKYNYNMWVVDDIVAGRKPPGKNGMVDRLDFILGANIAKLEKTADIYATAKIPPSCKKLAAMAVTDTNMYDVYTAKSFELFMHNISTRLYAEKLYVDISAGKGVTKGVKSLDYDITIEINKVHADAHAEWAKLEVLEHKLINRRRLQISHAYKFLKVANTLQWKSPQTQLGRIYDEDGILHKWSIFIIDGKEITDADLIALRESGKPIGTITDRKCIGCGILKSDVALIDDAKIRESLYMLRTIDNFFRFYENRCPVGNLHQMEGLQCTKCGLAGTGDSVAASAFYRKYKDNYVRDRLELSIVDVKQSVSFVAAPATEYAQLYATWTFNFNIVLDLAHKTKVNQRVITAMGAVEKQDYADIQSGEYIPSETDERWATRVFVINSHIKNFITEYNQIRFFYRLNKPSMDLSALVDSSGISKHAISELEKQLPDVYKDYNARFEWFSRNKKPREIVDFGIQSFCEMCLEIYSDQNPKTEKLRHDFTNYIVKKILRSEELLTKPGQFNWALLYGEKETKAASDSYDMNLNPNLEKETDREFEETEKEDDDFGDTAAPFASEFDMEEPDEEGDENETHVEGYGLN